MIRIFMLLTALVLMSCADNQSAKQTASSAAGKVLSVEEIKAQKKANHKLFHEALRGHLQAISARDIEALKQTLAPDGVMHLLRPSTIPVLGADKYISYHEAWFKEPSWTIKASITDSDVGTDMGYALVDLMYKVPNRDGKPY